MLDAKKCGMPCPGLFDSKPGTWGRKRQPVRLSEYRPTRTPSRCEREERGGGVGIAPPNFGYGARTLLHRAKCLIFALSTYPGRPMSRSIIFFIFKLTVSAVLIGFLATNFDFGKSAEKLLGADGAGIGFAILVLGFLLVNNTARWRVVMLAIQAVLDVRDHISASIYWCF